MECRFCNSIVEIENLECQECQNCGAVVVNGSFVRQPQNRPQRQFIKEVNSENYNDKYRIYKASDNSYGCTCPSFLFQRGTTNGATPFVTCKHIRREITNPADGFTTFPPPSKWQITALKRLGVEKFEHLTNAQAYFIFNDLLERQGLEYKAYESHLKEHGKISTLPLYSFGVEFEGLVRSRTTLQEAMQSAGFLVWNTGYNHDRTEKWKIATDSSVRAENGFETMELVSPKLFGVPGFNSLKKALELWNGVGGKVNSSCGLHVHVDAYGWDINLMFELAKIWAKIEVPVLWYLVSPSRRGNRFCNYLNADYFHVLSRGNYPNRYFSLNVSAFARHKTIEFRLHNGTSEYSKAVSWVIFCLKLVDAVKKGLRYRQVEPTFDGVMSSIGMDNSAIPLIKEAKTYLSDRYAYWKTDAEANPSHVPSVSIDVDGIMETVANALRERERTRIVRTYSDRRSMVNRNPELPSNAVQNLASLIPSGIIPEENFRERPDGTWMVPSRMGDLGYQVRLDSTNDTLSCECRGFRTHNYCYHSINLARLLTMRRQLASVEE